MTPGFNNSIDYERKNSIRNKSVDYNASFDSQDINNYR